MRFDECVEKGLIKRDPKAAMRVETSLDAAERFLLSSKPNLEIQEYEMVEIAAYNSAFHSARSLLFARGYVEVEKNANLFWSPNTPAFRRLY